MRAGSRQLLTRAITVVSRSLLCWENRRSGNSDRAAQTWKQDATSMRAEISQRQHRFVCIQDIVYRSQILAF